jgi:cytochrome c biogenesis protein CcmG, thiol:disulfide interchange protein DsbE
MTRKKTAFRYVLPVLIVTTLILLILMEVREQHGLFFSSEVKEELPAFKAPGLFATRDYLTPADFKGQVVLLNVWASWCPSCRSENPILLEIQRKKIVPIYSLVYKDNTDDARAFLAAQGNPYVKSGIDSKGAIAHQLRVYGTPETFLIDKHGTIRYRQVGVLDDRAWQEVLLPLVDQYKMEK